MSDHDDLETRTLRGVVVALAESTGLGFLTKVLKEVFPKQAEQAQQRAIDQLGRRLREAEARIDEQQAWTPDFYGLFNDWARITRQTAREEKLLAAANIVTNSLLKPGEPDKLPFNELEHFSHCVENLSVAAIHVLAAVFKCAEVTDNGRKGKLKQENIRVDLGSVLAKLPTMDQDLVFGLCRELDGYNLVYARDLSNIRVGEAKMKYAGHPVETTPLGFRFVTHIIER